MKSTTFNFAPAVQMSEVAATLELATIAMESLFGPQRLCLESAYLLDPSNHRVVINVNGEAGRSFVLVFLAFVRHEFGNTAVTIKHGKGGRT